MGHVMQDLIPLGLYRHYKGKDYSVLGFAKDSETQEQMVLYVPLYGDGGYWVRPLSMFTEEVEKIMAKLLPDSSL